MKIIHCADIHLDSPLSSFLSLEKAKVRKNELLNSFGRMIDYAVLNNVKIIIIAGDLFDNSISSNKTKDFVIQKIKSAENVDFIYLKGNHDSSFSFDREIPGNLKIFDKGFNTYMYENVCVGGLDLSGNSDELSDESLYQQITFDKDNFNIAVMHGSVSASFGKDLVKISALQNKNIDYLALGHIHSAKVEKLDSRGVYAYSGVLEGRGFDECGQKGFIMLDTDTKKTEFITFSSRVIEEVLVDITGVLSNFEIVERIKNKISSFDSKNIVRVVLEGSYDEKLIKDILFLEQSLENKFFHFSIKDNSAISVDFDKFKNDISLTGEFIRLVNSSNLSENMAGKVIEAGLSALRNEDISL